MLGQIEEEEEEGEEEEEEEEDVNTVSHIIRSFLFHVKSAHHSIYQTSCHDFRKISFFLNMQAFNILLKSAFYSM